MSKAQTLIDRYEEIAEKAGYVIASFGLEIQERDKLIAELRQQLEGVDERIVAAMKVYECRVEQVEGFANKTASDMYEALKELDDGEANT